MSGRKNLSARLKLLKSAKSGEGENGLSPGGKGRGSEETSGSRSGRGGELQRRIPAPPGWEALTPLVWRKTICQPFSDFTSPRNDSPVLLSNTRGKEALFYDLETTGLSGGAGTLIFLAGFGWVQQGTLVVEQLLLLDYPGEYEFLRILAERLEGKPVMISYNGKTFDRPLLRTRFLLHGIPFPETEEVDLLHPARACFSGNLPSCSLGEIERSVLNISRREDIDGYLIPEVYFQWLKTGDFRMLQPVVEHHRQDIVSLAELFSFFELCVSGPGRMEAEAEGRYGWYLIKRGIETGESLLRNAWGREDAGAGRLLSLLYKRCRRYDEARVIWEALREGEHYFFSGIELAKYYEHRNQDYHRALGIVQELLSLRCPGGLEQNRGSKDFEALEKRKERLVRRIALRERKSRRD